MINKELSEDNLGEKQMNQNDEDEAFFQEIEEYIKEFHLDNGADEEIATMLGKIGSYWNRTNIQKKSWKNMIPFRRKMDELIEEYQLTKQMNNYEILRVLYGVLGKIIEIEENKRQLQKEVKYEMNNVNGKVVLRVTQHKE
jgi:hypothetical protein